MDPMQNFFLKTMNGRMKTFSLICVKEWYADSRIQFNGALCSSAAATVQTLSAVDRSQALTNTKLQKRIKELELEVIVFA
jgi:hypothetical protein